MVEARRVGVVAVHRHALGKVLAQHFFDGWTSRR
jgi:hypothetical protein